MADLVLESQQMSIVACLENALSSFNHIPTLKSVYILVHVWKLLQHLFGRNLDKLRQAIWTHLSYLCQLVSFNVKGVLCEASDMNEMLFVSHSKYPWTNFRGSRKK